jgi:DNA-binding SARP family transcriptional activator
MPAGVRVLFSWCGYKTVEGRVAGLGSAWITGAMASEELLRIHLFEPLHVQLGERPPLDENYPRRKAKALFIYLYLNRGRWLSKYQLLADLWPESEHADPGRVKHTVQILRSALEGPRPPDGWHVILEKGGFYGFNTNVARYSDVEDFEERLALARRARDSGETEAARAQYRRLIEVRHGPFLSEFRYDDWAAIEIARQHDLYLQALEEAARLEDAAHNYTGAIELSRWAIREDPLHESSYVELMRSLWLDGRRTDALREYHRLREVLAKRLEVEPQAQTTLLYEAIRRDSAVAV